MDHSLDLSTTQRERQEGKGSIQDEVEGFGPTSTFDYEGDEDGDMALISIKFKEFTRKRATSSKRFDKKELKSHVI